MNVYRIEVHLEEEANAEFAPWYAEGKNLAEAITEVLTDSDLQEPVTGEITVRGEVTIVASLFAVGVSLAELEQAEPDLFG